MQFMRAQNPWAYPVTPSAAGSRSRRLSVSSSDYYIIKQQLHKSHSAAPSRAFAAAARARPFSLSSFAKVLAQW